jgi:hypothetical protein
MPLLLKKIGMAMTGKKSRRKGAAYENAVAKMFRDIGFDNAKRHLEFQGQEAEEGRDLDGTQPFAVQAKCWAKTPSISAIEQVVPSDEYPIPVAILKRTQSKGVKGLEVAVLPLDVFLRTVYLMYEYVSGNFGDGSDEDLWQWLAGSTVDAQDGWSYLGP